MLRRSLLGAGKENVLLCLGLLRCSGGLHYGQNTGNLESPGRPVFLPCKSHLHCPRVRVLNISPSTALTTMEFGHKGTSCDAKRLCSPIPIKGPGWSNQSRVLLALGQKAQSPWTRQVPLSLSGSNAAWMMSYKASAG